MLTSSIGTGGSTLFSFLTSVLIIEPNAVDAAMSSNPMLLLYVALHADEKFQSMRPSQQ